jgi:aminoglycoside phosphotransferase (APT) family kinase protein
MLAMDWLDDLVRPGLLGARLAEATADERWRDLTATLIAGGKSNLTFELASSAGELIFRRPPSGTLLAGAHDMVREARAQRALATTRVPVPHIVLDDAGGLLGVPFYVMRKVPGHVLRDALPDGFAVDGQSRVALSDTLVDTLVDLHAVKPASIGLSDFGRPNGFMARQIRTWTRQWNDSKTHDVGPVDELASRLAAHDFAEPSGPSIVHGDYRIDNCIFSADDPSCLTAVLDWELCTLGDPIADLGMLLYYWVEPGEPAPLLTPSLTALPGFPSRRQLVQRYSESTGCELDDLAAYLAFAHLKFAGIAQGIAARTAGGQMAGQDFGDIDAEVERIGTAGLELLERREWHGFRTV